MNIKYMLKPVKLIVLLLVISTSFLDSQGNSNELNTLIKHFCLDELKRELKSVGKEINNELGEFTCNCFIKGIEDGKNLTLARDTCKEKASKNFNL